LADERRLLKSARLRKRREFLLVQNQGVKISAACLLALALPNGTDQARLGLTVSSKVGNSVTRNRIRRRLREAYRHRRALLPKGIDVVLIARQSAAQADTRELTAAFEVVVSQLNKRFP
jgi:ribonuclease P protein component